MSSRPLSINVVKKVSLPHFLCQTITQWSFFLRCGTIFFTCMLSLWGRHFFYRHCSFFCSHFFSKHRRKLLCVRRHVVFLVPGAQAASLRVGFGKFIADSESFESVVLVCHRAFLLLSFESVFTVHCYASLRYSTG